MYNIYNWMVFFFLLVFWLIGLGFLATRNPKIGKARLAAFIRSMVQAVIFALAILIVYDFIFRQDVRWETYTALILPPVVFAIALYMFGVYRT